LGSRLLPNLKIGAFLRKGLHVLKISGREPLHVGEGGAKIGGELVDDLSAPSLLALSVQDFPADIMIKPDLFTISRQQRPLSGALDALL
jgi:hypothetical protein